MAAAADRYRCVVTLYCKKKRKQIMPSSAEEKSTSLRPVESKIESGQDRRSK
jgi:hypothetical protein